MKLLQKLMVLAFLLTSIVPLSLTSHASTKSHNTSYNLSISQIDRLNPYVSLNTHTKQYQVKSTAKKKLSKSDYSLLTTTVAKTNKQLAKIHTKSLVMVSPGSPSPSQKVTPFATRYKEGVTKVEWYWWGARIYLSKTAIQEAGGGITFAGIWIPHPVVSKVCASLGVIVALCPGGVVFDVGIYLADITNLPWAGIHNIHWQ